ncbi:hypothetical protein L6452_33001 [Arctium lappa]|uniref:Uncharacterized protein n=1 Tax=Arctium lappa TaxID=4217 RepID=A0ACB8Z634_ARCLA|nr:hypothetical protein L6452_33001 [Arctium lappa]
MGVPSFYRWLVRKYPKIVVNAVEKTEEEDDDGTLPNPNGREFDNLYLDMNGIIHPCFHPEEDDDLTYEEVFENIFEYIDRILKIVRPRKLLYMAIDGVAPRAKMNQQRTRRFRNAKDREILGKEEDRLRRQYELEGRDLLPIEESEVSDSNVITPGTAFMAQLSKQLQTYIRLRISNHPEWQRLKFLHVWILREYLNLDLKMTNLPEKFEPDIERVIDDFIFICFFAGNDFLPRMPTLEIHEGAIDLLIHVYKEEFKNLGGYLIDVQKVDDKKVGYIKLKRVEKFILAVGAYEDKIFTKRSKIRESALRHMLSENKDARCEEEDLSPDGDSSCSVRSPDRDIVANTKKLKEQLKSYAREISNVSRNGLVTDVVKLGDHGWKDRYYKYKFSAETEEDMEKTRKILVAKYTEGLCWVLLYYFSGVPSWTWFFPYHYGPFASDLKGLSSTRTMFRKGMPFKPFDQLMAVLPPMSAHALPVSYQSLMTDEDSSIRDFYPTDAYTINHRAYLSTYLVCLKGQPFRKRSYTHVQAGAKTNPNVGSSKTSSCHGVVIRGGGSGWSPIGRGNYNSTRPLKGQTSGPSYSDAYGRGARRNNNSNQLSRWTDHSHINSGFEQKGRTFTTQSTKYPARIITNKANDQFWSARIGSGLGSKQAVQRWGETQSKNDDRW